MILKLLTPLSIFSKEVTNHVEVTQAGWGLWVHHDRWGQGLDGAVTSSCMTSELGDIKYQYELCDLKDLVSKYLINVCF